MVNLIKVDFKIKVIKVNLTSYFIMDILINYQALLTTFINLVLFLMVFINITIKHIIIRSNIKAFIINFDTFDIVIKIIIKAISFITSKFEFKRQFLLK